MPVKHKLLPSNPDSETLRRLSALLVSDGESASLAINRYNALCAALADAPAPSVEEPEVFQFNEPTYHEEAMGCGLEDRGITDRYEAMAYGWNRAVERCGEGLPDEPLVTLAAYRAQQGEKQ